MRWLQRAATHNVAEAQALMASLCVVGLVAPGDAETDRLVSTRLFEGDEPSTPDFELALKWARRAADNGSARGQAVLAYILKQLQRRRPRYRRSTFLV